MLNDYIKSHEDLIFILTIVTIITFIGSLIIIPIVIIHLSPDYFSHKRESLYQYKHPFIRYTVLILKNLLGYVLFILGFIMLFIPGQGLLSMGLGVFLMNFPGKKSVEYKIFSNKKVKKVINLVRKRAGRSEIDFYK